jgi:hypothetical protein
MITATLRPSHFNQVHPVNECVNKYACNIYGNTVMAGDHRAIITSGSTVLFGTPGYMTFDGLSLNVKIEIEDHAQIIINEYLGRKKPDNTPFTYSEAIADFILTNNK